MPATITIVDESTAGVSNNRQTLEFPTEQVTVREIILSKAFMLADDAKISAPSIARQIKNT